MINNSGQLWFGLEVAVAAVSGLNVPVTVVFISLVSIGMFGKAKPSARTVIHAASSQVTEVIHQPAASASGPAVREPEVNDEVEAYARSIRQMTEDELERQLEQRLQKAFLMELRRELERRQRLQQPQPDYDRS